MPKGAKVAVIGAGAAGVCALRWLQHYGLAVTCFERSSHVGGVWVQEQDTACYPSLRTNLPCDLMEFAALPFRAEGSPGVRADSPVFRVDDTNDQLPVRATNESAEIKLRGPRFPPARTVQRYLNAYAAPVRTRIRFERTVERVELSRETDRFVLVHTSARTQRDAEKEEFDAIVVASGHYHTPAFPLDLSEFSGAVMHSHDYYDTSTGALKEAGTVLVVGDGPSGCDLVRDLLLTDKTVYWSAPGHCCDGFSGTGMIDGVTLLPRLQSVRDIPDSVDTVVLCTGYKYSFPFLDGLCGQPERQCTCQLCRSVQVHDGVVGRLMQHMWPTHPALSNRLCFVGLPAKVVPFPLCDFQSEYAARVIAGLAQPPADAPVATDHVFTSSQFFHYLDELKQCGALTLESVPESKRRLYESVRALRRQHFVDLVTNTAC
ncbi:MAG: hypothetical protein MHM6MM_002563 [Cercozoa sp. M6MM]